MSTYLATHRAEQAERWWTFRTLLLACGALYGLAYIVANDVVAAMMYDGYSRIDQAISELSATEAPSKAFLTAVLPVFSLLVIGFGVGVWRTAERSRPLRVTGVILIAQGFLFPLWLLFPLTSREEIVEGGTMGTNDVGHLVLGGVALTFILAEMGFSSAALGKRFGLFSLAMAVTILVFGALTGVMSADMTAGDATPWMGFIERVWYGAWLVWMAGLAVVLLRKERDVLARRV